MCGISGIVNRNNQTVNSRVIKEMNDLVSHRGPDDEGFFFGSNFAFGHRRLSIIDLSKAGHQPMTYLGKHTIIYNGEVYNYLELKNELTKYGYQFKSRTDTEVILAAYDRWGTQCVEHFNGMWAFAIHDPEQNIVFCSRDRFGIKPFYYATINDQFCLASEIKQFAAVGGWEAVANNARVIDFLKSGIFDHTQETLFDKVYQLRGGHNLTYRLDHHSYDIQQWYDIKKKEQDIAISIDRATNHFQDLFADSINLRLRSDVKVGTCLSGGLDSSSIVCAMNSILKKQGSENIQESVSSCFDIKQFDEQEYIDEAVKHTGIISHKVFPQFENLFSQLDKIIWHQDEPFGSTSIYAQWHVFGEAAKHQLTVMLDGQGADEQLAGYFKFYTVFFRQLLRSGRFVSLFNELVHYKRKHNHSFFLILNNVLKKNLTWLKNKFFGSSHNDFFFERKFSHSYSPSPNSSILEQSYEYLTQTSLPMLLHYEDRNSMAHSVESRVPFLDYRLVEFLLSLPDGMKIKDGTTKWILRYSLKDILPGKIISRHDKMGFVTPESHWLNENKPLFRKEFLNAAKALKAFVDYDKAQAYFDRLEPGDFLLGSIIWRTICLGRWVDVFKVKIDV